MKLICERERLLQAFQIAAGVPVARTPKSILENLKLRSDWQRRDLMATDLEMGVRIDVPGIQIDAGGSVCRLNGGMILRESPDEN